MGTEEGEKGKIRTRTGREGWRNGGRERDKWRQKRRRGERD